jgi:hypothetical protein
VISSVITHHIASHLHPSLLTYLHPLFIPSLLTHPPTHPPPAKQQQEAKIPLFIEIEPTPLANRQPFSAQWNTATTTTTNPTDTPTSDTHPSLSPTSPTLSPWENLSPFGRAPVLSPTSGVVRDPLVVSGKIDPQREIKEGEERARKNAEAHARLRDLEGEVDDERAEMIRRQRNIGYVGMANAVCCGCC